MEGKRPGGLTALAVLNFVFGGILAIVVLLAFVGLLFGQAIMNAASSELADTEAAAVADVAQIAIGVLWLVAIVNALIAGLLIASGVGYIKQTKTGRNLGNAYAIIALVGVAISLTMAEGGFDATIIFSIAYPVVTLVLINGMFKDNLVR